MFKIVFRNSSLYLKQLHLLYLLRLICIRVDPINSTQDQVMSGKPSLLSEVLSISLEFHIAVCRTNDTDLCECLTICNTYLFT